MPYQGDGAGINDQMRVGSLVQSDLNIQASSQYDRGELSQQLSCSWHVEPFA